MSNLYERASEQGAKVWLRKLLLAMLPDLPKDKDSCNEWFNSLIQAFESRGLIEPKQKKNYLTQVRNAIKIIDSEHPALDVVKFDKSTWVEINNSSTDRIAERNTKFIGDPEAIANKAKELITSKRWSEIAAGLAVLTGRRSSEVIKTAKFSYKTKFSVMFSGSLKRRNEPIDVVFEIPTLCEASLVIDAIARLRRFLGKDLDELSVGQVSGRYSRAVAKKCDQYFAELVPKRAGEDNLYSHLFRAIYATIASHWYCPPTVPEMEYRAAIQGHYQILEEKNPVLRRSLEAGRHYYDYRISDGSGNIDGRLGIKLGQLGVEVVEQFTRIIDEERGKGDQDNIAIEPDVIESGLIEQPLNKPSREKDFNQSPKKYLLRRKKMNETVAIPRYLMSRLMVLSQTLELDEKETLEALFDWAEISLSLAEILEIEELKSNLLYDKVEGLIKKLRKVENSKAGVKLNPEGTPDDNISINAESIRDLSSSVRILSELVAINTLGQGVDGKNTATSTKAKALRKTLPQEKTERFEVYTSTNKTANLESINVVDSPTQSVVGLPKAIEPETDRTHENSGRKVSQRTIDAEAIINSAIDKIIEFNEQEGIAHKEKIRIGIGGVRTLTGRGDNIIRRVLKRRKNELEEHHRHHELSPTHNSKGKTAPSIDEVIDFDKDKVIAEISS
ncbi:MAG: protelomerase family protein [Cyanobacteria bacterium J06600_6]